MLRRREPEVPHQLPAPLLPAWMACSAPSTPVVADSWLGGNSLDVARNWPTMAPLGIKVQSLSPHQRPYGVDCSCSAPKGLAGGW